VACSARLKNLEVTQNRSTSLQYQRLRARPLEPGGKQVFGHSGEKSTTIDRMTRRRMKRKVEAGESLKKLPNHLMGLSNHKTFISQRSRSKSRFLTS